MSCTMVIRTVKEEMDGSFNVLAATTNRIYAIFKVKANFFENSFFPTVIMEWNKIDVNNRYSAFCNVFKKVILKFIRPELNQVFNVGSSDGLNFPTRMTLGLSPLLDHKL